MLTRVTVFVFCMSSRGALPRLPIALMRNRGQDKESMGRASGFAEVELKLSNLLYVQVLII